jgi:FixJ family two-component response regulator
MLAHRIVLIAVVDDDASFRLSVEALIRSLGWEIQSFDSAEAFLASPLRGDVDCIICDIQMPGMSGIEMKQRLIEDGSDLPVIFVTALADPGVEVRAMASGALMLLHKPFDAQDLIDGIHLAVPF